MSKVTSKVNPVNRRQKPRVIITPPPKILNHIALVIDESGSMSHLSQKVIEVVNSQLGTIKSEARNSNQETLVSVYTFQRSTVKAHIRSVFPEAANFFNYQPDGATPLNDAIHTAIDDFEHDNRHEADESFLIITVTDGEENASRRGPIGERLKKLQATDKWSFAFMVPPGASRTTQQMTGAPAGNIVEWEGTEEGLHRGGQIMNVGTQSYYTARSRGQTSTNSFFTNLDKITPKDLKSLDDVQKDYKRWKVDKEQEITEFVESHNTPYQVGRAFYELTKPEKVQSHKSVVIGEKQTKKLYGGDQAKTLIGIPTGPGVEVRVKPGNHGKFRIFVQSTSTNRKLVRGTDLLYKA